MTTHKGNSLYYDSGRRLHKFFSFPLKWWQFVEKSNVIFGVLGFGFTVIAVREDDPFRTKALLAAVLAFLLLNAFLALAQAWINGQKARYAEILEAVHQNVHTLRDLKVYLTHQSLYEGEPFGIIKTRVESDLALVLDRLVAAMSLVSSVKVNAYITQTIPQEGRSRVEVLSRDRASLQQFKHMDNPQLNHWVDENSALRKIMVKKEVNYYHNPNIGDDFESSFFEHFPNDKRYRSCLVFPIRGRSSSTHDHEYCGFLHIESLSRKAFAPRYDVDVGATIADSLYLVLSNYATVSRIRKTHEVSPMER